MSDKFQIKSLENRIAFEAFFADGSPMVVEGYGGWNIVDRPREIGITEWAGRKPMAIDIPFLIDFWEAEIDTEPGNSCELQVNNLEQLCGIGGHAQPPVCSVDGHGVIPHDETTSPGLHKWVIEGVTWDRQTIIRSRFSGNRMRAGGTIVIRQYLIARNILKRFDPSQRASKLKIYVVQKDDTLAKIAARPEVYGDANKWKVLADANNIRDPRNLTIGKSLKIP